MAESSSIDRGLWLRNLLDIAAEIANREKQESAWRNPVHPWETPAELINSLFDDCQFELFIQQHGSSLNFHQLAAAIALRDAMDGFNKETPEHLDPVATLADPRWQSIRNRAAEFVQAFS